MGECSIYHWLIVLFIVVLLFGGRKIPEVMKSFGEGIRSFKAGLEGKDSTRSTQHKTQGKSID